MPHSNGLRSALKIFGLSPSVERSGRIVLRGGLSLGEDTSNFKRPTIHHCIGKAEVVDRWLADPVKVDWGFSL